MLTVYSGSAYTPTGRMTGFGPSRRHRGQSWLSTSSSEIHCLELVPTLTDYKQATWAIS